MAIEKDNLNELPPLGEDKHVEVVKIAELKVSDDPQTALVTYALGSCIAVTLYDPAKRLGGMLHFLLPEIGAESLKVKKSPLAYADSGLDLLLEKMLQAGAAKEKLQVKVAGGSRLLGQSGVMDVGRDNYHALLKALTKHGLSVRAQDVGGEHSRTAMLEIDSGALSIKSQKKIIKI